MPRFYIDGKEVEIPPGGTVLDGARRLGIKIPTLCHLDGLEPRTSCFVCLVKVEGKDGFLPACGLEAHDGMRIIASSKEVADARRAAIELLLSDHAGDCEGPCTIGCPAGMDIPGMIRLIAAGRYSDAGVLARKRIALPASLGCICPRFCERVCRRGEFDEPVAICALKRFAGRAGCRAARGDAAGAAPAGYAAAGRQGPAAAGRVGSETGAGGGKLQGNGSPRGPSGKRVAIIGAGPAGLSAAYCLVRAGHACAMFDRNELPGGMLRYAVPRFRLPIEDLEMDIEAIMRLGVEFRPGMRVGSDISLERLRREYDAVLIAAGAPEAKRIGCEGGHLAVSTLELLEAAARGARPEVGGTAAVIGSDAPAFDAARTCRRLGAESVVLLMPAPKTKAGVPPEIAAAAEAEGVRIVEGAEVLRIEPAGESRLAVACGGPGGSARFEADRVFAMSGRAPKLDWAADAGLPLSPGGWIAADRRTLATNIPGVFAAGEAAAGIGPAVRAAASGRLAAVCIDQYLRTGAPSGEPRRFNSRLVKMTEAEKAAAIRGASRSRRSGVCGPNPDPGAPGMLRTERAMEDAEAEAEAARCLRCGCAKKDACGLRDLATEYGADQRRYEGERRASDPDRSHPLIVYDPGKCIMCGLCIAAAEKAGEARGISFIGRGFAARMGGAFFDAIGGALGESAPECAAACPTGALAAKEAAKRPPHEGAETEPPTTE